MRRGREEPPFRFHASIVAPLFEASPLHLCLSACYPLLSLSVEEYEEVCRELEQHKVCGMCGEGHAVVWREREGGEEGSGLDWVLLEGGGGGR